LVALESLRKFVQRSPHKGAFYTLSHGRFLKQHKLWMNNLPTVAPYYAVKCNPDPILLKWMYAAGIHYDCASAQEIHLVKELFFHSVGNKVLLANPCKTPNDIQVAKKSRIPWVTCDSVEEILKMDQVGYRPEVLLRLAVDDSGSACPFNIKFGILPSDVEEIARAAKDMKVPIVGMSFHVGSGSKTTNAFKSAIETSKHIWNELYGKYLVGPLKTLDIGGGWSSEPKLFIQQASAAKEGMKKGIQPQQYIAEPGRFYAAPTQDLYVQVVGKKPRSGGGWRYTIDESIYGQFSCIPFDHCKPKIYRIQTTHESNTSGRPTTAATIFGRTCDSLDWICNSQAMQELNVGDWLYIPNMGAYTTATATEFNGFPKPEMIITDNKPRSNQLEELSGLSFPLADMLSVKDTLR
jgi:ornithine decarboxylase